MKITVTIVLFLLLLQSSVVAQAKPELPAEPGKGLDLRFEQLSLTGVMYEIGQKAGYSVVLSHELQRAEAKERTLITLDVSAVSVETACALIKSLAAVEIYLYLPKKLIEVRIEGEDPSLLDAMVYDMKPLHAAYRLNAERLGSPFAEKGEIEKNWPYDTEVDLWDILERTAVLDPGLDRVSISVLAVTGRLTTSEREDFDELTQLLSSAKGGLSRRLNEQCSAWEKLCDSKLALEGEDLQLGSLLDKLRKELPVSIVLHPGVDPKTSVSVTASESSAWEALGAVLQLVHLEMSLVGNCILVVPADATPSNARRGVYAAYEIGSLAADLAESNPAEDREAWEELAELETELQELLKEDADPFYLFSSRLVVAGGPQLQARVKRFLVQKGWKE